MQNSTNLVNVSNFSSFEEKVAKQEEIEMQNEESIRNIITQISHYMADESNFLEFVKQIRECRDSIFRVKSQIPNLREAYFQKDSSLNQELSKLNSRNILSEYSIKDFICSDTLATKILDMSIKRMIYPMQALMIYVEADCHANAKALVDDMGEDSSDIEDIWFFEENSFVCQSLYKDKIKTGYYQEFFKRFAKVFREDEDVKLSEYIDLLKSVSADKVAKNIQSGYYLHVINSPMSQREQRCIKNVNAMRMNKIFEYYAQEISYWEKALLKQRAKEQGQDHSDYGELE